MTLEVTDSQLKNALKKFTNYDNLTDISDCNIYIATVPTPIDKNNPNFKPLLMFVKTSKLLKKEIVVFEAQ